MRRNPRFEFPCRVRSVGRVVHGWSLTLELDPSTTLKVYISDDNLVSERIIGESFDTITGMRKPITTLTTLKPDVSPGDTIYVELNVPVNDDT